MSLTMPRRYTGKAPAGERRVICDFCGMTWYRSVCRRLPGGMLACPDDQDGRDSTTLDRLNAANAAAARLPRPAGERW